jgi:ubiquinone/menaquinone biosynthesis C-methylase UbiE
MIDKRNTIAQLHQGQRVAIELGCGPRKRDPLAIGIDMLELPGVDLVGDVFEILALFPDASVSSVYTAHFLEHVPELPRLLGEIARVAVPGGGVSVVVPHFSNPFYFSDPTHRTPFGLYTLAYFCEQQLFRRTIPRYGVEIPLVLESVELGFKSYPPRYLRHAFKRMWGIFANAGMYTREFYEENLCWLVPCYEVRYELRRR